MKRRPTATILMLILLLAVLILLAVLVLGGPFDAPAAVGVLAAGVVALRKVVLS